MKTYLLILFPFFLTAALAHGDLDGRILSTTEAILEEPQNDSLYTSRGTLYFQHQEYMKSIRDFEKVESLIGPNSVVYMSYAKAWHQLSKYQFALENIDLALKINPKNSVAYRLKGEVYFDMREYEKSADNYALCLEHTEKLITESFLEVAIALDSVDTSESLKKSIDVLQEGRTRLADLEIFKKMIVDQHVKLNNYDQAIKMQTQLIEASNRKERHYFKRAKLYILAQDISKAKEDIKMAYDAIGSLPHRYIRSKPIDALREELNSLSQKISK